MRSSLRWTQLAAALTKERQWRARAAAAMITRRYVGDGWATASIALEP